MVLVELDQLEQALQRHRYINHSRPTRLWIANLRQKVTRFNLRTVLSTPNPLLPPAVSEEPTPPKGPPVPAAGNNGRWVLLGQVGVDSATLAITDPAYAEQKHLNFVGRGRKQIADKWGSGLRFTAGFGDGHYDIWAWIVDYGDPSGTDERIAQITLILIDDEDLAHWRNGNA